MSVPERILVLAPHTDDAELGCGASVARWLEEGAQIAVAAFSTAETSLPEGSKPYRLKDECNAALDVLGVPQSSRFIYDFPVRELSYHRQEVLELLVRHGREFNPDWVVVPSGADLHQDHHTVYAEALRAFKHKTLLGYELPWNHITFSASAFVTLEQRHLDQKWAALTKYESQLELNRPYFTREFVESIARVRGLQVKAAWAEAFELIRIVL
ncbi:MAG: PIG-L deacetylase family protein [Propionibacteriaceae bacterium]|nr:PIG-L deacetylase family protein [Propionibacteriaceae bacterium]